MVYVIIRSAEYIGDEVVGVVADKAQAVEIVQRFNANNDDGVFWYFQTWKVGDVIA